MGITKEGLLIAAHNIFDLLLAVATLASVGGAVMLTASLLAYWTDNPA